MVPSSRLGTFGPVASIGWVRPHDETSFSILVAGWVTERGELGRMRSRYNGKAWAELTGEEHQRFPGDWEAQVGQGPITLHSEEHLATSDRGVAILRRFWERQAHAVARGEDPAGVASDAASAAVSVRGGKFRGVAAASEATRDLACGGVPRASGSAGRCGLTPPERLHASRRCRPAPAPSRSARR